MARFGALLLLAGISGCCAGGLDVMTFRIALGPDVTDTQCRSSFLEWNGTTTTSELEAVVISANGAGRGAPDDWIQIFDETGARVPVPYFAERDHACEGGCPGTKHFYPFPGPGTYTLVHFRSDGRSSDDDELSEHLGEEALVTTLVVESAP